VSNIQISNIFLWQKNKILRNLPFRHNQVNVITGDSGKGKSSILYIIDYCLLASETKGISKTNIDSKVEWYGIKIAINGKELVIARPSEQYGEHDRAYFSENGEVPDKPILNIKIENLKQNLSRAFGIDPELKVPYGGRHVKAGTKVSFRNFLAYCYQDQNAIIASDHLFIRPADGRYQEAIERTLRMAIGVENVSTALARNRLTELERKRVTQTRKLDIYNKSVNAFTEEIQALSAEAKTLGILAEVPEKPEARMAALQQAVLESRAPVDRTKDIERIDNEIFSLTAKNRKLATFMENKDEYRKSLADMADALMPVSIFNDNAENIFPSSLANEVIFRLQRELADIKTSLRSRTTFPFLAQVDRLVTANEERLAELRKQQEVLSKHSAAQQNPNDYYRYLGRLEAKLDVYKQPDDQRPFEVDENLDNAILELQETIADNKQKVELSKQELNRLINDKLSRLKLKGYDGFSAYFSERERLLHLYAKDLSASFEKMPDIGSASNYLYLHLAFFLALHEIAKIRKIPWIPSFLVLDQPSTPYFTTDGKPNDDIRSLDAALTELNDFVEAMDERGGFQIILLEHIEQKHWTALGLERFHLVDRELRDDYGLILDQPPAPEAT